jgi:hypothetical protein
MVLQANVSQWDPFDDGRAILGSSCQSQAMFMGALLLSGNVHFHPGFLDEIVRLASRHSLLTRESRKREYATVRDALDAGLENFVDAPSSQYMQHYWTPDELKETEGPWNLPGKTGITSWFHGKMRVVLNLIVNGFAFVAGKIECAYFVYDTHGSPQVYGPYAAMWFTETLEGLMVELDRIVHVRVAQMMASCQGTPLQCFAIDVQELVLKRSVTAENLDEMVSIFGADIRGHDPNTRKNFLKMLVRKIDDSAVHEREAGLKAEGHGPEQIEAENTRKRKLE